MTKARELHDKKIPGWQGRPGMMREWMQDKDKIWNT